MTASDCRPEACTCVPPTVLAIWARADEHAKAHGPDRHVVKRLQEIAREQGYHSEACPVHSGEVWKDIPGYEGSYQASDAGRIRSLDRRVRKGGGGMRFARGQVLAPGYTTDGYLTVQLGEGNKQTVHGLVALAFVGPRPRKHVVMHLNDDPADSRLENLRYGTYSENIRAARSASKGAIAGVP